MSSDSEDDCYGNVAQQLQNLKNQYQCDKIESVQLLNDSNELDEIVKNNSVPAKNKRKSAGRPKKDTSNHSPDALPDISLQNASKRATRSSTRNSSLQIATFEELPPTRSKRNSSAIRSQNSVLNTSTNSVSSATASRGRRGCGGRARARGRSRGRQRMWLPAAPRARHRHDARFRDLYVNSMHSPSASSDCHSNDIPTYSVGNTEDYPDQCDSQALFSNKKQTTADVVIVDDDNSEENEEFSVKVYWTSSEFYRFSIRRFQKITQIFDYFAKKENISQNKLLFRLNGKILKPNDTPDSIGYNISKIIDGGIVEQGVSDLITRTERITDGIKLKFQCQNMKKPLELTVKLDDKFSLTMVKVAEYLEIPLEKLRLEFDGDSISGKSSAQDLELEGGECIDVKIIS